MSWSSTRNFNTLPRRWVGGAQQSIHTPEQQQQQNGVSPQFSHNSHPTKTSNLSNSAVSKMLKEDRSLGKMSGVRKVIWPPPQYTTEYDDEVRTNETNSTYLPPYENHIQNTNGYVSEQEAVYQQTQPSQPAAYYRPLHFSPPPTMITLRETLPTNQSSPPLVISQPVTATIRGGSRRKGDEKWPPQNYRMQAKEENEARIALARGPVFRPRRPSKDFSTFLSQNTTSYPGYRPPPGTQHYFEDRVFINNGY